MLKWGDGSDVDDYEIWLGHWYVRYSNSRSKSGSGILGTCGVEEKFGDPLSRLGFVRLVLSPGRRQRGSLHRV